MPPGTSESSTERHRQTRLPRLDALQFSMSDLLILIFVLSVAFTVLFAMPNWAAATILIIATILLLAVLISALVYARGRIRAFCIGALVPTALVAVAVAAVLLDIGFGLRQLDLSQVARLLDSAAYGLRALSIACSVLAIVAGTLSVLIRQHFARSRLGD